MDYSKTIIYKIVCNDLNITECYVGHTTNFIQRKNRHKSNCNCETNDSYNFKIYKFIRDNGNWNNWTMIEIEKYPCNDINEATARERYWYEQLNSKLNTDCPARTQKEYYNTNKEQILEQKKQKFNCECGNNYSCTNKARHMNSQKHINFMASKTNTTI